jgi:hypothetical protein
MSSIEFKEFINKINIIDSSGDKNKPPLNRNIIMQLPEFQSLTTPQKIKTGWLNDLTKELQDLKDENPNITEEQMINHCKSISFRYVNNPKYNQKTSQTWEENIKNIGFKPDTIDWICGWVKKNENEYVFLKDDSTGEFIIKNPTSDMVGKNVCAKVYINNNVINIQEWKETGKKQQKIKKDNMQFEIGDRVRHRRRGVAFSQITGKVNNIINNLMYVKWDGIKNLEVFNLDDTVSIYSKISKL